MSTILVRSLLSPLKIAPSSYSSVHVLLSPSLSGSDKAPPGSSTKDTAARTGPFLPAQSLPVLVEQCPSLTSGSFQPSPHLPNGHLQTIYSTLVDTVEQDPVRYTRRVLLLPDGGILSLDFCEAQDSSSADEEGDRSTIVIAHGLTGGSQESYVRHCIKRLSEPHKDKAGQQRQGYRCVVVNFRGCANTPITSSQLYSAAKTSDLRSAVLYLRSKYPRSPLIGLGFSLGANVLAKYLGEEGDETPMLGGIVCAAPLELKRGSDLLEGATFRRQVYSRAMNGNLTRMAERNAATLDLDEAMRSPLDTIFDAALAQKHVEKRGELVANSKKTLKFVDDNMVINVGGHHKPYGEFPFESADAYYKHGGALNFLQGLQRPMLALNADDDPIVSAKAVEGIRSLMGCKEGDGKDQYGHTDYIVLATTQGGGHLGWWQGFRNPTRWLANPVVEFADALTNEYKRQSTETMADVPPRETVNSQIVVELMPASLLPPYLTPQERKAKAAVKANGAGHAKQGTKHIDDAKTTQTPDRNSETYKQGARLPWLRTRLLKDSPRPLLHPSMAREGWTGGRPLDEAEFKLVDNGEVDPTSAEDAVELSKGWSAFEATMTSDAHRPEVGFSELQAWTRVAGAGEQFQGGKEMAGMYHSEGDAKSKGAMVAGL